MFLLYRNIFVIYILLLFYVFNCIYNKIIIIYLIQFRKNHIAHEQQQIKFKVATITNNETKE